MTPRDLADLTVLAALWGGSYLFMRVAAPEFGPVALIAVRVAIAAAFLLAVLGWRRRLALLKTHPLPMTVVGIINSALPFSLFAYAALSLSAGMLAIVGASSPLWGAIVARLWLGDRLDRWRILGLLVGFGGIVVLAWEHASFKPGGSGLAIVACLGATLSYGVAASYTKRKLTGVDPLASATGSLLGAALAMAPLAALSWPAHPVSTTAWASVIVMGIASTGWAYTLYFRLIARVGPAKAITVTYLSPVFALLWGTLFLGEGVTGSMLAGGAIVLAGTALSTGLVRPGR